MSKLLTNHELRLKLQNAADSFVELAKTKGEQNWHANYNRKLDNLVSLILSQTRESEVIGASKAAVAVNGELGLELTKNGAYYLDRYARLHKG